MTVLDPVPASSSGSTVTLPAPPSSTLPPWITAAAGAGAVLVVVLAVGVTRGALDLLTLLAAPTTVVAADVVTRIVGRRALDLAERRWLRSLDEVEAACAVQLASRRRSLRHRWPASAELVERLRRDERPPVVGSSALVVLGTGEVVSGVTVVDAVPAAGRRHPRVESVRARAATLPDGPLCVDASGGVHVTGPSLLAESLAGGYRAQLRHRGARVDLVTWHAAAPGDRSAGGAATDAGAACVVEISPRGDVAVVRRDGLPCSVPVVPSWTSSFDAPAGPPDGEPSTVVGSLRLSTALTGPVRPRSP